MSTPCSHKPAEQRQELKAVILSVLSDLHNVALQLTRSETEAEDLVAETVARACENFPSLRDRSKAKQWMLRILTNVFLSTSKSKRVRGGLRYEENNGEEFSFSLFDEVSQPFLFWGNPERELISKFLDEDITKAIGLLPEDFRVVVVLCDIEGYTYEEIARTLDVPVGTVRSRLSRGRSQLQKRLFHHAQEHGLIKKRTTVVNTESHT